MIPIMSLFSGIGGLELGLEAAGFGPATLQVESDVFCRTVLARHWPDAERRNDVKEIRGRDFKNQEFVLCGGFPCQDVSSAGRGEGLAGARSVGSPSSAKTSWLSAIESAPWGLLPETLGRLIDAPESSSSPSWTTQRASDENGLGASPKCQDGGDLRTRAREWGTPTAHLAKRVAGPNYNRGDLQRQVVDLWPAATATDSKASGAAGYSTASGRHSGTTLTDATVREYPTPSAARVGSNRSGAAGLEQMHRGPNVVLNPDWVEALMGFPPGWTDVTTPPRDSPRKKRGSRPV
jgi:hypothetical protein